VSLNKGADGVPNRVGAQISDVSTGLYAYQALATALYARYNTGIGRLIDVSLTQATAALLGHKLAEHVLEGGQPRALNVPAGSYRTRDGWLVLTLVTEQQYQQLCTTLGCTELIDDPRFNDFSHRADNAESLISRLKAIFLTDETTSWLERLTPAGVLVERVFNPSDWLNDPHVVVTQAAVAVPTDGVGTVYVPCTPGAAPSRDHNLCQSPARGQHNTQILEELGIESSAIEQLMASGIIHAAPAT
jgi:crotonobetainyl-CoA:carnitine CoA-transferase CaiB-like acyl-CoA transferase